MPKNYDWVTQEMFDNELIKIISEATAGELIQIPDIYSILAEHYNNDVLENLEENREKTS